MTTQTDALSLAIRHHQAGEFALAEPIYRHLIVLEPNCADAWHLLGALNYQRAEHQSAIEHIQHAIALNPAIANYHNSLGVVYQALRSFEAAAEAFQHAIRLNPVYPEAYTNLSSVWQQLGRMAEAEAICREALKFHADRPDPHFSLGNLRRHQGDTAGAVQAYREAERLRPAWHDLLVNLGDALRELGQLDEAVATLERAVQLAPTSPLGLNNLGLVLSERGDLARAVPVLEQAIRLAPNMAEPYSNLGNIRFRQGQFAAAVEAYQHATSVRPDYAQAFNNLGAALLMLSQTDEAVRVLERAVQLQPNLPGPFNNLGTALKDQGRLAEALRLFQQAVSVDPACAPARSSLLYCLNYTPIDGPALLAEHRQWEARHTRDVVPLPPQPGPHDPERPLRVGYVSPDFRRHPVTAFMEPVLRQYDRGHYQTFVYSESASPDDATAQLRSLATGWRDTFGWTDLELVERVRADEIDILVELAGHTSQSRLRAFAFRPAPIQVSYLGYPATTGLSTIDYRLSDAVADPPGEPDHYSEQLWRLLPGFCCYMPGEDTPPVSRLPCASRREITFGALHHLAKLNGDVLDLWAALLAALPEARLLLFRDTLHGTAAERLAGALADRGVSADRFELRWQVPAEAGHLAIYHEIDVALDVFPWSGHTTACEALWMGVPVVTLRGNRFAGRMVASVLTLAGRSEWIADSGNQYVAIAQRLVEDRTRLAALRASLRQGLLQSALCDGAAFTRSLEDAYRGIWQRYCATSPAV